MVEQEIEAVEVLVVQADLPAGHRPRDVVGQEDVLHDLKANLCSQEAEEVLVIQVFEEAKVEGNTTVLGTRGAGDLLLLGVQGIERRRTCC